MAANTTPIFTFIPNWNGVKFVSATGTTAQVVFTSGADASRLERVLVASCDDKSNTAYLLVNLGGILYPLAQVTVQPGQGYARDTNPVNLLENPSTEEAKLLLKDFAANGYWDVPANTSLLVRMGSAVSGGALLTGVENFDATFGPSSKEISVLAIGSNY